MWIGEGRGGWSRRGEERKKGLNQWFGGHGDHEASASLLTSRLAFSIFSALQLLIINSWYLMHYVLWCQKEDCSRRERKTTMAVKP